ncbi:MAG: hypothetical protein R2699_08070 [Acidimicrobiales bacterium]
MDLPMPGSPPRRVTERGRAATEHPIELVDPRRGAAGRASTGTSPTRTGPLDAAPSPDGTSVFQASQPGQRPTHWSDVTPQALH